MARRETCFKSFINPPRALQSFVVRNNLRPVETDVKSVATRCCGRESKEHNIQRKYSQNQKVRSTGCRRDFEGFSATNPPVSRRLSAGFCTTFRWEIRRNSTFFPHLLRRIFDRNGVPIFRRIYEWIPKEIADSSEKYFGYGVGGMGGAAEKLISAVRGRFFKVPNWACTTVVTRGTLGELSIERLGLRRSDSPVRPADPGRSLSDEGYSQGVGLESPTYVPSTASSAPAPNPSSPARSRYPSYQPTPPRSSTRCRAGRRCRGSWWR